MTTTIEDDVTIPTAKPQPRGHVQPTGIGRATLHFPRFLCGYDEEAIEARALASYAYDWRRR